ncbi:MAG TPA: FHA domain-containing protein, partial [Nitrospirales bacterium]
FKHGDTTVIGKYVLLFQENAMPDSGHLALDPEKTMILDAKKQRDLFKTMQTPEESADRYPKLASLMIVRGKTDRKVYELSGPRILIGSHRTATIKLSGWFAPRHAAVITHDAGMYVIKSEGSKVTLNGLPVAGRKELQNGDWFSVAGVVFEFSLRNKA